MNWFNVLIFWIGTSFTIYMQLLTYKNLSESSTKNILKFIGYSLLCGLLVTYNLYNVDSTFRAFISFTAILLTELLLFKDGIIKTISASSIGYILVVVSEIVLDIFLLTTKLIDLHDIDSNISIKVILSIIIVLPALPLSKMRIIKNAVKRLEKMLSKSIIWLILIMIGLSVTIILAFKNVINISFTTYIGNLALLVIFLIMIIIIFYNYRKAEKEIENTKILLNFMIDYEKQIEDDRINRHEMLNNLLILKSYDNKNSQKFSETLDDLIESYNKKNIGFKNIYKLPSGLKGIVYYKVNEIRNKNIIVNINISKRLSDCLGNLSNKTYAAVCKIVGITFDNAIDAVVNSKDKIINFDVYEESNRIVLDIENSFNNKLDFNKIGTKNYSTKGKNRGLGLYIVKNIIKNNSDISIEQCVDGNIFISKIYVKK